MGEGIWSYAWNVATRGHPPATPFDVHEAGLAIDPPIHRSQHQVDHSPTLLLCHQHCCRIQPAERLHAHVAQTCCELPLTHADVCDCFAMTLPSMRRQCSDSCSLALWSPGRL